MKNGFLKEFLKDLRKNKIMWLMVLPAIILVFLMCYIPMTGIVLAFKDYKYNLGIFGSEWIGFENFKFFFTSGTGWIVTRNTILYNAVNLFMTQALAIAVAVIISEMTGRIFKKVTQSILFLPYFISWIIVGIFVYNIFNYETGTMNTFLKGLGLEPINLYDKPYVWPFIIVFFNSWKWVGYTSVVYIASISGIDGSCMEAADIEGANVFQKIRYITIPAITPTIVTMLLLNVSKILRGDFQMFYQIIGNNGQLFETTDVIDTFVFRSLITSGDISMSSAATFYQSVLCFAIIMLVNGTVKKVSPDNALF